MPDGESTTEGMNQNESEVKPVGSLSETYLRLRELAGAPVTIEQTKEVTGKLNILTPDEKSILGRYYSRGMETDLGLSTNEASQESYEELKEKAVEILEKVKTANQPGGNGGKPGSSTGQK